MYFDFDRKSVETMTTYIHVDQAGLKEFYINNYMFIFKTIIKF